MGSPDSCGKSVFLSRTSLRQMGESKHMYETVKKLLVEELQIKEQDILPEA